MRRTLLVLLLAAVVMLPTTAGAEHAWGMHWNRRTPTFTVQLLDRTAYDAELAAAAADWSQSAVLDVTVVSECSSKICATVQDVSSPNGLAGWTNATADVQAHFKMVTTSLNVSVLAGADPAYVANVVLHEVGHTLGLGHGGDGVMGVVGAPITAHDLEELELIYAHSR